MSKKNKRAKKIVQRTTKAVQKLAGSVGPVLAGLAAGLAARDATAGNNSYLEEVGKDFARLLRTLGTRAVTKLQPTDAPSNGAGSNEHAG